MKSTPLLTGSEWATFLAFGAALVGVGLISPRIASIVGVGAIIVLVLKNAGGLGLEKTS